MIIRRMIKFEKPKILYLSEKALVLFIIWSNRKNEEKESIEILKFLDLIENI